MTDKSENQDKQKQLGSLMSAAAIALSGNLSSGEVNTSEEFWYRASCQYHLVIFTPDWEYINTYHFNTSDELRDGIKELRASGAYRVLLFEGTQMALSHDGASILYLLPEHLDEESYETAEIMLNLRTKPLPDVGGSLG